MSGPEAMFFFGRTSMFRWDPEATTHSEYLPVFQIRSVDKGHTWEDVPVVLDPPPSIAGILKDNHPPVTMPDGARVGTMTAPHPGSVWLYGSENHGMTWPLYLGFFEFVHNMRKRGKALLECLIKGVLGTAPRNP